MTTINTKYPNTCTQQLLPNLNQQDERKLVKYICRIQLFNMMTKFEDKTS